LKADDVGVDVRARVFERIAHAGLGGEIDYAIGAVFAKRAFEQRRVRDVAAYFTKALAFVQPCQTRFLERDIVIVVDVVHADHAIAAVDECVRHVRSDESGGAGNQYLHADSYSRSVTMSRGNASFTS